MKVYSVTLCIVLAAITSPPLLRADLPFSTIAIAGEPAPGLAANENYSGFTPVSSEATGTLIGFMAFVSGVSINSSNDVCVYSGARSDPMLVAREGTSAPTLGGETFRFLSPPTINVAGTTAFRSTLNPSGVGIFRKLNGGALQTLARNGSFVDSSSTVLVGNTIFGNRYPIDAAGNVYFGSELTGSSVTINDQYALLRAGTSVITTIARSGITIPAGITQNVPAIRYGVFYDISVNQSGQVAFVAALNNTPIGEDSGIWRWNSGAETLVVREGDDVPGLPGTTFGESSFTVGIGDDGTIGFCRTLIGSGVTANNEESLWTEKAGTFKLIVREGDPAPDLNPGVEFDSIISGSGGIAPAISPSGRVAFLARVRGPGITNTNDDALWVQDGNGNIRLVVREGSLVENINGAFEGIGQSSPGFLPITLDYVDGFPSSNRLLFTAKSGNGSFDGIYEVEVPGDTVAPSLSINGLKVQKSKKRSFRVTGSASDNNSVSRVEVKVGGGGFRPAIGTAPWSFNARLKPGTNRILARATDGAGNLSEFASTSVRYQSRRR